MIDFDGLAALCLWTIDVEIDGATYTVPPTPAYKWIIPIRKHDMLGIVPGMIDDTDLDSAIYAGNVDKAQCEAAAHDAITKASGMMWWCAYRIVHAAMDSANLCGSLALRLDARTAPFGAWCSAAYSIMTENAEQKHRRNIDTELMRAPAGMASEDLYDPQAAAASFDAMLAAQQSQQGQQDDSQG